MDTIPLAVETLSELPHHAEYYGMGLAPYQIDPTDPFAKSKDIFELIKALRQRSKGNTYILVANSYSNVLANSPGASLQEGQDMANRLARVDQILYEAVQDVLENQGDSGRRIPVHIMSDLIDGQKFSALMYRLTTLIRTNPVFAEAVYACVPESFRPKKHAKKTLSELAKLPGDNMVKMYQRMDYVLQQIAQVLLLKGKKLGHAKENAYNDVAIFAASLLDISTASLSFEQLDLQDASGTVPYRTVRQCISQIREGIISAETDLGMLSECWLFRETELDEKYDAAQEHVSTMDLLYREMLIRADADLQPTIKFRYVREMICTLIHGPEPVYAYIFSKSGVLDVINGSMSLDDFEKQNYELPFLCTPRGEDEPKESYFIRFVDALLHNDGPMIPGLRQTGIQYKMCEKIHQLAEQQPGDGWTIRFREFYRIVSSN